MGETSDPSSFTDRIRSWARHHASTPSKTKDTSAPPGSILPTTNPNLDRDPEKSNLAAAGSLSQDHNNHHGNHNSNRTLVDGVNDNTTRNHAVDSTSSAHPPPAPPPFKSEAAPQTGSSLEENQGGQAAITDPPKPPMGTRAKAGTIRFWKHTYDALTHSWVNLLLVFVPAGIVVEAIGANASIVFALNAVAIIPLAGMLAFATEVVAERLGDTLGALMNVSFGNAVELIIFIIALSKDQIRIVQASLVGSILSNLLLILGMAFLVGGLRFQEQIYNSTVTQMSACLLSLSVVSLVLPTAFHASFTDSADADVKVLKVSRGTSVVLLIVYVLYLLFQLKSHAYMYESTPQQIIDEESHPGILADMLGSSSDSSDSSSSSSSDSEASSSHTTSKRIRRAFRRRRKSSASTITIPSVVSSPSVERDTSVNEPPPQRRLSTLGAVNSGDEADTDGEPSRRGISPRVRDFGDQQEHQQSLQFQLDDKPEGRKNKKKRHHKKKHHHKRHGSHDGNPTDNASVRKHGKRPARAASPPKVNFANDVQYAPPAPTEADAPKRPFAFRPALPKMLSQNVFVNPPPVSRSPVSNTAALPRTGSGGLRRTNSLPDRLNRQNTPVQAHQGNLPPYPRATPNSGLGEEEDEDDGKLHMSRTAAVVLLLISTALVAVCAEFMVDAIPEMIADTPVSQAFIGLIILPIVSNAAEHVTAVTVAAKNKMDLSIGVSVGSSIQIALFVTPLVVILGWIIGRDMSLYFTLFETISLFVTAFVVNFLVLDGRSNYLEGSLLIAAYVIIAVSAFYYPDGQNANSLAGS